MKRYKKLKGNSLALAIGGLLLSGSTQVLSYEFELEEIVVTAQKRSQSINDVPMSIQAFSGDTLKNNGVSDAAGLVQITPGLTYAKSPTNTPIFTLRGIGFNTTNLSSTSTVGLYVDEVAYAYPYMANGALFDMERVEVLKGPQGTLYGRNTTGGLVNFIANKPGQEFEAGISAEVGNYETTNLEGFINTPITDNMALRLAGRYDRRNQGYQRSVTRGGDRNGEKDSLALRAILNWEASEDLNIVISGSYWQDKSDSVAGQIVGLSPEVPDFVSAEVRAIPLDRNWDNETADWQSGNGPFGQGLKTDSEFFSIANRIEYDINDSLTLVSLTSYNKVDRFDGNDFDGTSVEIFHLDSVGEVKSFSQELRLVGDYDRFNYILGAYYSNDDIIDNQLGSYSNASQGEFLRFLSQNVFDPTNAFFSPSEYTDGFRLFRLNLESENTSKSVFGKVDYDINDEVQVSLGLRYTEDRLESTSCSADYEGNSLVVWNTAVWIIGGNTPPGPVVPNGCMTLTPDFSAIADPNRTPLEEDNIAGRMSVQYTPNNEWLLYGSISRGYKSGAWPVLTAASSDQLDAATQEKVTAFEMGTKTSLLDGAAQLNTAIFYYDYEDKQLLSEVEDLVFTTLPRLVNVPKSNVYGAEIDFNMQVTENLATRLSASYTKSEVEEFMGFRRLGQFEDFAGDAFPYTPEWQFSGSLTHKTSISDKLGLVTNLSASYRSESSATIGDEQGFDVRGYALVNADISLFANDDKWAVGLFVKNLFDTYHWTSVDIQTDAIYRIPGLPREYGAKISYNF